MIALIAAHIQGSNKAPEQMMLQLSKFLHLSAAFEYRLNFLFHFLLTNVIYLVFVYFFLPTQSSLLLSESFSAKRQLRFSQICYRFAAIQK